MLKTAGLLIVVILTCKSKSSAEEACFLDSTDMSKPLQVAFAVDRTIGGGRNYWTVHETTVVKSMTAEIAKKFPESEFALALFSDYPDALKPRTITEKDDCYTLVENFSRNQTTLMTALNDFKTIHNNDSLGHAREATLVALMMTAADLRLRWDKNERVRKVIVLVTNAIPSYPTKNNTLQPPKGDGTDTCATSLPPDNQLLQKVLNRRSAITVGALFPASFNNISVVYENYFDYIYSPYMGFEFPNASRNSSNLINIAKNITEATNRVVEYLSAQIRLCVYNDPPAYNTLGL